MDMHLSSWEDRESDIVAKLRKEQYFDDLVSESTTDPEVREFKERATEIFLEILVVLTSISGILAIVTWNQITNRKMTRLAQKNSWAISTGESANYSDLGGPRILTHYTLGFHKERR